MFGLSWWRRKIVRKAKMLRQHSLARATGGTGSQRDQCFLPCCDYRKLNLLAFAGSVLYIGYMVGYSQSSQQLGSLPLGARSEQAAHYSSPSALRRATTSPGAEGESAASDAAIGKNDEKLSIPSLENVIVGRGPVKYNRDKPVTSIVRRLLNSRWNSELITKILPCPKFFN